MVGSINFSSEFAQRKLLMNVIDYVDGVAVVVESFEGSIVNQTVDSTRLIQASCPVTGMSAYFNRIGWYYGSLPQALGF